MLVVLFALLLTVSMYLFVPVLLIISGKKFNLKTIRIIAIVNATVIMTLNAIAAGEAIGARTSPALIWGTLAYVLLKNKCLERLIPSKNYINFSSQNVVALSLVIESVYYFDYTNKFGYYDLLSGCNSALIKYNGVPIPTPVAEVKSDPIEYYINQFGSKIAIEYINARIPMLHVISETEAEKSNQFIVLRYENDSITYFEYDEDFCKVFEMVEQYKL